MLLKLAMGAVKLVLVFFGRVVRLGSEDIIDHRGQLIGIRGRDGFRARRNQWFRSNCRRRQSL